MMMMMMMMMETAFPLLLWGSGNNAREMFNRVFAYQWYLLQSA